jgi:Transposase DDE domain
MKGARVRNWCHYNKALIQRGNITLWINENILCASAPKSSQRGRPFKYTNQIIEAALVLKNVFHLTFRSLQGFLESLKKLMAISAEIPNYTTLCRRQETLKLPSLSKGNIQRPSTIVVDSTGVKIYGEGEWCVKKHGAQYQRTWRKIHLAVDANDLQILSCKLTTSRTQDFDVLDTLLKTIATPIGQVIGDGSYDTFGCYEAVHQRGGIGLFPPKRGSRLSSETPYHRKPASLSAIAQRDVVIKRSRDIGTKAWKIESEYHRRSLVETTMYRFKHILGERLRSKKRHYQQLEATIRCYILNKLIAMA